MAVQTGKRESGPYVPPLFDLDAKDRFGLPLVWSLLGESPEEREARVSAAERLIKDAFETAAWHLGHEEARARFAEVSKQPERGKQPDAERNKEILEWYDREVKAAPDELASIPRRMAEHNNKDRPGESVETFQKRIRRLVAARDEAGAEHDQAAKVHALRWLEERVGFRNAEIVKPALWTGDRF